ncbi:MAG: Fe-S cluster assembly protein SufD [Xanthomonadales bacterium]|nr:Fe-S cluster assembly protein SufD [Xanthomonadales bacterium]
MATPLQQALDSADLPADQPARRQALEAARAAAWPARRQEHWRYTSLHALGERTPRPASLAPPEPVPARTLLFRDGRCTGNGVSGAQPGFRVDTGAPPPGDAAADVFDHLNRAFAIDGADLRLDADGDAGDWLVIAHRSGAGADDRAWHLRHRIELGAGSRARILFDFDGAGTPALATVASAISLAQGAELDLAFVNAPAPGLSLLLRTGITLAAGARLRLQALDAGAAPSRHELAVDLAGAGASAELGGAFVLAGRQHADVQMRLRHLAPDCSSTTTWRALADDRARAVFDGQILVATGADGTDARLECKSLLGSSQAEIDVKPVLEIHADDVRCAHGATIGQLDPLALFYLRSRGIDAEAARALLVRAFAAEALAGFAGDWPVPGRLAALTGQAAAA